ncbi:MAG: T9SS type A sorting domain-containing protein, partial [Deltaproteobacteria bacterium]
YSVPSSGAVTLKVYDVLGREVATIVDRVQNAGNHSVKFDGSAFASGMYVYRLRAGKNAAEGKMMLLK